jgi:hypothetical protein
MVTGDIVKFKDGLYSDEKGARYRILEVNGDRAIIVFICDLPIPPQSAAKISELEIVQHGKHAAGAVRKPSLR